MASSRRRASNALGSAFDATGGTRMGELFRQAALERLAAPEQLDHLMRVVRPKDWLVLATFAGLVVLAVIWSLVGQLPVTVDGRGVLIHPRTVVAVQAPASGRLSRLDVQVGDLVNVGDVLGTIDQAETRQRLQEERRQLQQLIAQDREKKTLQDQQVALRIQRYELERKALLLKQEELRKRLRDAQAKAPLLKQRVDSRRQLEKLGLMPRISDERLDAEQVYLNNQDTITALQAELQQLDSQVKQLESQQKRLELDDVEALTARQNAIQELQSRIALDEGQLARQSQIVSDRAGRILELTVNIGQMIEQGARLGSIEVEDAMGRLVGLTYFPIKDGKKITPDMTIHIAPDTIERERFGSIVGRVVSVSRFPVTKGGIASLVGHPEVVDTLVASGPSIEVMAELTPDPSTFSQYHWSSSQGPALPMTPGTTTTARVVVEHRAPITYVLPILRDISGIY
jgi:HlyD family secretion protein